MFRQILIPHRKDLAIEQVKAEIRDIIDNPVSNEELEKAKKKLKIRFAELSETVSEIGETIGFNITVCGDINGLNEYLKILQHITLEDIQNKAKQYLDLNKATISVLMPKKKVKMTNFIRYNLQNGVPVLYRQNKNTPRTAINIFIKSVNPLSLEAGVANLMSRLFLQGTKKYSAEEIAKIIDNNGLELGVDVKQDYIKVQSYFLNEDFDLAIDLIDEILKNSTFEKLTKEIAS
jgi:zinc protease